MRTGSGSNSSKVKGEAERVAPAQGPLGRDLARRPKSMLIAP
jgi:hypothetical protein